ALLHSCAVDGNREGSIERAHVKYQWHDRLMERLKMKILHHADDLSLCSTVLDYFSNRFVIFPSDHSYRSLVKNESQRIVALDFAGRAPPAHEWDFIGVEEIVIHPHVLNGYVGRSQAVAFLNLGAL